MGRIEEVASSGDDERSEGLIETGSGVLVNPEEQVKEPSLFKVLLHNDDYTPMDFVVELLEQVFHKDRQVASRIMLDVHHKGIGVCGLYPYEVAETKVAVVTEEARKREFPLRCTLEADTEKPPPR